MPRYLWLSVFREAQEEKDLTKVHELLLEAEDAILRRMQELGVIDKSNKDAQIEVEAIRSSLNDMLRMKTERLGWPAPGLDTTGEATA